MALTGRALGQGADNHGNGGPVVAAVATSTGDSEAYLSELVARAMEARLYDAISWRRLLHYREGLFGWASEIDGGGFFLSAEGKTNPAAELTATIRELFRAPVPADAQRQHPYCRFPARLAWLNAQLGFDFTRLQKQACPSFEAFRAQLRPESFTLVFSSYYLNNPASALGHTFLRANKPSADPGQEHQELLDYGIDYSATVDTDNSLLYAIKGLLGMFPGTFRKLPYYYKVREYNDHESRDMWEYELNFTPIERDMIVAHLWELGSSYANYYYLSENCSYQILAALEAGGPRIDLLRHVGWPVIPADTVKALFAVPGLVRDVRFRPSNRTTLKERLSTLTNEELEAVEGLTAEPTAALPAGLSEESKVRVLDAALDFADFHDAADLVNDGPSDAKEYKQRLLERRAGLHARSEPLDIATPVDQRPERGHGSMRLGLGSGFASGKGFGAFHQLDARIAFHGLDDPPLGYPETMQIEFAATQLRYYVDEPRIELQDLSLLQIVSLTPLDHFMGATSWRLRIAATRPRDSGCDGCLAGLVALGGGGTLATADSRVAVFALGNTQVWGLGEAPFVRAGVGPFGGLRVRWSAEWVSVVDGEATLLPFQSPGWVWSARAITRWLYRENFAVGAEALIDPLGVTARVVSNLYF